MTAGVDPIKRTLCYQRSATVGEILEDLAMIRVLDRTSERRQSAWTAVAVLGFVGVFFLIMPWIDPTYRGLLGLASLVVGVVGVVQRIRNRRTNFEDRRYELVEQVLGLIAKDSRADAAVEVVLDLRRPDIKEKFQSKGKAGHWDVKHYADPWLNLRGRLLDGTTYRLSMLDRYQARSRVARSRSGKSKLKRKTKRATRADLMLKVKTRRFPGLATLSAPDATVVKLPQWAELKRFAIEPVAATGDSAEGAILLAVGAVTKADWTVSPAKKGTPHNNGVQLVAMMLLSLYQMLNGARDPEGA